MSSDSLGIKVGSDDAPGFTCGILILDCGSLISNSSPMRY